MAGLCAFRASVGSVESSGTTPVAGSLDSLGLVAHNPETLLRLGKALQLPGGEWAGHQHAAGFSLGRMLLCHVLSSLTRLAHPKISP